MNPFKFIGWLILGGIASIFVRRNWSVLDVLGSSELEYVTVETDGQPGYWDVPISSMSSHYDTADELLRLIDVSKSSEEDFI